MWGFQATLPRLSPWSKIPLTEQTAAPSVKSLPAEHPIEMLKLPFRVRNSFLCVLSRSSVKSVCL
jgi:hypothetical protein